jgi:hydroxymethylpyrimidine pyrophosphatase-like HAD family hydrolase
VAKAVISDIDDTLIHFGKRIDSTYAYLKSKGAPIILITGRPESSRAATTKQLHSLGISYSALYMNPGSSHSNNDFKKSKAAELLKNHQILCAVENNPAARAGYASLGIHTIDPAKLGSSSKTIAISKHLKGMKNG